MLTKSTSAGAYRVAYRERCPLILSGEPHTFTLSAYRTLSLDATGDVVNGRATMRHEPEDIG